MEQQMTYSENTNELFTAFAKFKKDCPIIKKDKTVEVKKNGRKLYDFEYASLGNILKTTEPVLAENGLAVIQNVGNGFVQSMLIHESGQYVKSSPIPTVTDGTEQEQGSSITYKRRYQISGLLNIESETDDDGNAATGNDPKIKDKGKPKSKKQEKPKPKKEEKPEPEEEGEDSLLKQAESVETREEAIELYMKAMDEDKEKAMEQRDQWNAIMESKG